jgi:P-type Cu+ transporter
MVGTGKGAEHGILFRNAEALERLHQVKVVVLDKTGTLTEGKPRVTDVVLAGSGSTEEEIVTLAAAAELGSEHPLGEAIVRDARERGLDLAAATDFASASGQGVTARVSERTVAVGREATSRRSPSTRRLSLQPQRSSPKPARRLSSSRSTAALPRLSRLPTRSKRRPRSR